jgi:hypothetical protein
VTTRGLDDFAKARIEIAVAKAQLRAATAAERAATAAEKNARYVLGATVAAAVSAFLSFVGVLVALFAEK